MWGVGEGRFTEKVSRKITLRGSCLLGWGFMKPSRWEEKLGPEKDDQDRLGIGTGASVCPPTPCKLHNAYRKESSNLSTFRFSIKINATITRLWGPSAQGGLWSWAWKH